MNIHETGRSAFVEKSIEAKVQLIIAKLRLNNLSLDNVRFAAQLGYEPAQYAVKEMGRSIDLLEKVMLLECMDVLVEDPDLDNLCFECVEYAVAEFFPVGNYEPIEFLKLAKDYRAGLVEDSFLAGAAALIRDNPQFQAYNETQTQPYGVRNKDDVWEAAYTMCCSRNQIVEKAEYILDKILSAFDYIGPHAEWVKNKMCYYLLGQDERLI